MGIAYENGAVALNDISKTYNGKPVLKHVSVRLEQGGIYCLMGQSGIGKTTLLRILMGLEQPDGEVCVAGKRDQQRFGGKSNTAERSAADRSGTETGVSAVFQENRLFGFMDAVKNIRIAAGRRGLLFAPEQVLEGLLEPEAWYRPVSTFSGGMQRRAAIARALAVRSGLLLLDEPFAGLDEVTKRETIRALLRFRAGRTLLVVTHREEDAVLLGAQVLRLGAGSSGQPAEIGS